jgi:sugar lactone lactonase YvrE
VARRTATFYGQAMTAGDIYAVAGDGGAGDGGIGGPATAAQLYSPDGVVVDAHGNLVISSTRVNRVEVVAARSGRFYGRHMTAGDIYRLAGTGPGFGNPGNGGPAIDSRLAAPQGLAVDQSGNVIIADTGHSEVRVVAATTGMFYGQAMTAGDIYSVGTFFMPGAVTVDGQGNLVVPSGNSEIQVVAGSTGTFYSQAMTAGGIYTVAGDGTAGYSGDGGPATAAELDGPQAVAVDGSGNLVIADTSNNRVRVVAVHSGTYYGQAMIAGDIYTAGGNGQATYSGDGVPATTAELGLPQGVTQDAHGNLVIADTANRRIRVVAAADGTFYGQAMTAGNIYTVAGSGANGAVVACSPDNLALRVNLSEPDGLAVDANGNLVIADPGCGFVGILAATSGTFYGQ